MGKIKLPLRNPKLTRMMRLHPMTEFPDKVVGETFSKNVMIYDLPYEFDEPEIERHPPTEKAKAIHTDREIYADLGYYDFEEERWEVFGCLAMKAIGWTYIPELPRPEEFLTDRENYPVTMID